MKSISLNGEWSLSGKPQGVYTEKDINIKAHVPGCVQLDMSRAGILPSDLFFGKNILEAEKYERYEWWYEKKFIAPEERERVYLVFRGVDCIAEYFLNGEKIGESENMFIPHEFEVGKYLLDGENTLTVHIKSPIEYTHNNPNMEMTAIALSGRPTSVETAIRRPAHSYGWDIMPRAVTSGIWRDVTLEVRDAIRFKEILFDYRVLDYRGGRLRFCYITESDFADFTDIEIEVDAVCGESRLYARRPVSVFAGNFELDLSEAKLWWPYGYGEANVYDATLRIYKKGNLVHERRESFGIRSVELQRTDVTDGENGYFRFKINGEEIMCKGSNWVPMDAFHSRDAERYEAAIDLVRDTGCNILRCWGGNVYEDHKFFDLCDRAGIMVWQDFAMACASYPKTEEFYKIIHNEAVSVIKEYRNHPSIILWSGDNEVDSGLFYGENYRPSTNKINREILRDAVLRNDPTRPYLASSPYISDEVFDNKKLINSEDHLWGERDYHKSDFHKHSRCHFVSEAGYHGCPSLDSIKKFISTEKVWPYHNNDEWILHSSDQAGDPYRVDLMEYQVRQMLGSVPSENYILASQISQAEAKKYFIERMRIGRPKKSGMIWWNIVDGWPQMSDAVVDYYYNKKLAYYYIKRSQRPFIIALDELYDRYQRVCACNDTLREISGRVKITDSESGRVVFEKEFTAPKNTSTEIGKIYTEYHEHKMYLIEWETDGERGFNHYTTGFIPYDLDTYKSWIEKYKLGE